MSVELPAPAGGVLSPSAGLTQIAKLPLTVPEYVCSMRMTRGELLDWRRPLTHLDYPVVWAASRDATACAAWPAASMIGGFILKALLIPAAKAVIVGFFVKRFFQWLRGQQGKAWASMTARTPPSARRRWNSREQKKRRPDDRYEKEGEIRPGRHILPNA
jgi:hypothetical protein